MPSPKLIAALALLAIGGPVLMFPDLLPVAWQTSVVTLVTLAALGLGLVMAQPWKKLRFGLWLFLLAVVASWALMPVHDLLAVRHFAGIGVGVLTMAVVATWCTTINRLITATLLFAFASTGVLTLGLLGTFLTVEKLIVVVATPIPMVSAPRYPWLPKLRLGLPGLEGKDKVVNPNALGGTALMLLPTCSGLLAAALCGPRRRRLALSVGLVATAVATTVLWMARSRTSLIAALLTLLVLGLRSRRVGRWILPALLLSVAGVGLLAYQSRGSAPQEFAYGVNTARGAVLTRVAIWQDGFEQLRERPWVGVGINRFHEISRTAINAGPGHVAHAHNMLLQVALDVGVAGLCGYVLLFGTLVLMADQAARKPGRAGRIAAGAGLSLVAVHLFGLGDAIALGAKVGVFQWLCAGLILAESRLTPSTAIQ